MADDKEISELKREKEDLEAKLSFVQYDGVPFTKKDADGKKIYLKKKVGAKTVSEYVGDYTKELYDAILTDVEKVKAMKARIKEIEKKLV